MSRSFIKDVLQGASFVERHEVLRDLLGDCKVLANDTTTNDKMDMNVIFQISRNS